MGCNFVIAQRDTAEFVSATSSRNPILQEQAGHHTTILRLLVQNHNLNAFGVQPADVVIEPDVTASTPRSS
jgi:hypothetical protein